MVRLYWRDIIERGYYRDDIEKLPRMVQCCVTESVKVEALYRVAAAAGADEGCEQVLSFC